MINNLDEFKKKYSKACIVNYDIADLHGYGLAYRTKGGRIEKLRNDNGRYIEYPKIQPYSKLENEDYNLFFIRNNKMYELEKGTEKETFVIKREVDDVNLNIFDNIFYISKNQHKKSANRREEAVYTIVE